MIYFIVFFYLLFCVIRYDVYEKQRYFKFHYIALFVLFSLIAGLRWRLGVDTVKYMNDFQYEMVSLTQLNLKYIIESRYQPFWVLLNAFCEAENAISSYKSDYRSYKDFKDTIDKSKHYYNVANIRYSNGTGNKIDELAARRQVLINENSMYQIY